jgi:hypothetical protein
VLKFTFRNLDFLTASKKEKSAFFVITNLKACYEFAVRSFNVLPALLEALAVKRAPCETFCSYTCPMCGKAVEKCPV